MNDSPIIKAINLLRDGKIDDSRDEIGISNSDMSDQNYIQQISSLSTGLELVTSDQVIESIDHFQNSLELVEKCSDQEIKILVPLLIQYGNGLNQLHSGDAFGAYQSLQNVANEVNQLAFFDDELKKFATSAKASACIAIARTHISGGNVDDAQKWMAKAESIYDEVLDLLDEENPEDLPAFVEVYGLPVEIGAYWAFFDLQVLQIEEAQKRLELATEKYQLLQEVVDKMPETPTQKVAKVIMAIYENTQKLTRLSKKLLLSKNTLEAEDLDEIKEILNKLTEARETALQVGKRGHGNLWLIKQLKRFANNLIKIKSVGKKEINRFSGAISFFSFIIILFFVNLFFQPDQALGLGYFFGSLIVSLIIGYGFGAIKFIPLLKTYRDVLSDIKQ